MIPTILSAFFGAITIAGLAVVIFGFRRSLESLNRTTRLFTMGLGLLLLGYMLRGFYWDIWWQTFRYLDREAAYRWSELIGGQSINVIFYLISWWGIYLILKSRREMIDEHERANWPWYKAWLHPDGCRIIRWPGRR